ncbi:hypothetical protein JFT70_05540 [Bacillus sp. TH11]|nr:hypothetical protein [Bacillus sp. TH11]
MANIPTVCLGRNIRFNFAIQSYAQLYGEDWMTIDGNYGNIPYLLTTNESKTESIRWLAFADRNQGDRTEVR